MEALGLGKVQRQVMRQDAPLGGASLACRATGFRRDHLRAFAQRIEVVNKTEARIMGSKNTPLRVLAASNGVESAANGVRTFVD